MALARNRSDIVLDALGNSVRREIVAMLHDGPKSVGRIATAFPISRPAVSRHLKTLEVAKLVSHHSNGTKHLFRLEPSGFDEARRWLDRFWGEALDRFKAIAEEE